MKSVLYLLALQGILGALDTLYYHEWRARLPVLTPAGSIELKLHAARDFLYAIIFGTLPWLSWRGYWTLALVLVLLAEVALTMWDFVIEDATRKGLGGVYRGERVMHALMGIIYGAMLARLLPVVLDWWSGPTSLSLSTEELPLLLRWALALMAVGVFLSGVRDACAAFGLPHSAWPWAKAGPEKLKGQTG